MQELGIDLEKVKGHREFMQTACPGDQWLAGQKWKEQLRQEIARVQNGQGAAAQAEESPEWSG
jgi:hypothetical protein